MGQQRLTAFDKQKTQSNAGSYIRVRVSKPVMAAARNVALLMSGGCTFFKPGYARNGSRGLPCTMLFRVDDRQKVKSFQN